MKLEKMLCFGHKIVMESTNVNNVYLGLAFPYIFLFGDWSIYLVIKILTYLVKMY